MDQDPRNRQQDRRRRLTPRRTLDPVENNFSQKDLPTEEPYVPEEPVSVRGDFLPEETAAKRVVTATKTAQANRSQVMSVSLAKPTKAPKQKAPKEKDPNRKKWNERLPRWAERLLFFLFLPVSVLYLEMLLRIGSGAGPVFDHTLLYVLLFSGVAGFVLWLIGNVIPARRAARVVIGILLGLGAALFSTEYCVHFFDNNFRGLLYMFSMAGSVVKGFGGNMVYIIFKSLPFILLSFVPFAAFLFLRKIILPDRRIQLSQCLVVAAAAVLLQTAGSLLVFLGPGPFAEDRSSYRSMFEPNQAIPRFGVLTTLRLELQYAVFGTPEDADELEKDLSTPSKPYVRETQGEPVTMEVVTENGEEIIVPKYYEDNVLDIDFDALAASTSDETLKTMDQYFQALYPTRQNEYTGMFKGKNLIVLTCEAFSPYAIRQDLTPTLYKMQNEGFIFTNFYQPDWTQSTTGGEFAAMSGLIPTWVNGKTTFIQTANNFMPTSLGYQFRAIGYDTRAYHNNSYTYYSRHRTHPNMTYDYQGIGNGLVLENRYGWPESDLEMMKATLPACVDAYLESGQLFHTYYMTVSGHCKYGWGSNAMSRKNRAAVEDLPYSETVKAYLASQLELEYALTYVVDYCTEKGIIDDVVIVFTADHYPYDMTSGSTDYYQELEPEPYNTKMVERFKNSLIIWSSCMEKPVRVDVPCSAIDLVPTVCNLFGLEYDSRLYSGRDILATNYDVDNPDSRQPFVVFADDGAGISWISCAGVYNAYTKTFTPYAGYESYADNKDYVKAMTNKAKSMTRAAKLIVSKDYYAHVFR